MRVTKELMNKMIGHYVKAEFTDGQKIEGVLGFTSDFCKAQGFRRPNCFTINEWDIKPSHLKSIKENNND